MDSLEKSIANLFWTSVSELISFWKDLTEPMSDVIDEWKSRNVIGKCLVVLVVVIFMLPWIALVAFCSVIGNFEETIDRVSEATKKKVDADVLE